MGAACTARLSTWWSAGSGGCLACMWVLLFVSYSLYRSKSLFQICNSSGEFVQNVIPLRYFSSCIWYRPKSLRILRYENHPARFFKMRYSSVTSHHISGTFLNLGESYEMKTIRHISSKCDTDPLHLFIHLVHLAVQAAGRAKAAVMGLPTATGEVREGPASPRCVRRTLLEWPSGPNSPGSLGGLPR